MRFRSPSEYLGSKDPAPIKGPVAVVIAEDLVEVDSTLRHHLGLGFGTLVLFAPARLSLPPQLEQSVIRIDYDLSRDGDAPSLINPLIEKHTGAWLYYCYNAEYLYFPFCEHRTIGEMLAFHAEERRDAVLSYVIDLYAGDLGEYPDAVSINDAYLDRSGYYALARYNREGEPLDRQLNFHGGLRWRFEEHIEEARRRIDRISVFRAKPGLRLNNEHLFNDPEYNTYSCPWHHNITVAVASFRTAKALKHNAGSTFAIDTFRWHNSIEFEWKSEQLLNLGLMEPGQWF